MHHLLLSTRARPIRQRSMTLPLKSKFAKLMESQTKSQVANFVALLIITLPCIDVKLQQTLYG